MQSNLRPQGARARGREALSSPWTPPFHTQSLLRAPQVSLGWSPGSGDLAPLPSELQAWVREDMTTKNVSEGQRGGRRLGHQIHPGEEEAEGGTRRGGRGGARVLRG